MYRVNENCIGCGLCGAICPEVFELNADGLAENIIGDVPAQLEADADNAMASCPVGAIEK